MDRVQKITELDDLLPDTSNANRGTARGRELLEHSLREYGAGRSILADRNGVVIAGNKTLGSVSLGAYSVTMLIIP